MKNIITSLLILTSCFVGACGTNTSTINKCKDLTGEFRVEYTKVFGDCEEMPARKILFPVYESCAITNETKSFDNCSRSFTANCIEMSDVATVEQDVVSYDADTFGTYLSGTISISVSGDMACSGTYTFSGRKLHQ